MKNTSSQRITRAELRTVREQYSPNPITELWY